MSESEDDLPFGLIPLVSGSDFEIVTVVENKFRSGQKRRRKMPDQKGNIKVYFL